MKKKSKIRRRTWTAAMQVLPTVPENDFEKNSVTRFFRLRSQKSTSYGKELFL